MKKKSLVFIMIFAAGFAALSFTGLSLAGCGNPASGDDPGLINGGGNGPIKVDDDGDGGGGVTDPFAGFLPGLYSGAPASLTSSSAAISTVLANDVAAAITYINTSGNEGEYTLLLDEDVSIAGNSLNLDTGGVKLTLVGLVSERKISLSSRGKLFAVGAAGETGIELTLGNNITLEGLTNGQNGAIINNNAPVIEVQQGANLIMLGGAKISGNTASSSTLGYFAAVFVNSATFTMKGGTITGNSGTGMGFEYISAGGLLVGTNGIFIMEGGDISGNNAVGADAVIITEATSCMLSGNASIGILNKMIFIVAPSITIGSGWTGSVGRIDLSGNTISMEHNIYEYGNNRQVITAAAGHTLTAADIASFNSLGYFRTNTNTNNSQPISDPHIVTSGSYPLNAPNGFIIANSGADIGKLVIAP